MEINLNGKTALVTGSTKGIGFAIAKSLANSGANVIINGRTDDATNKAKAEILASNPNANIETAPFDLASPKGAQELFTAFPDIDILVNNLGIYGTIPFTEISDDDWMNILNVNVVSGARLSRFYLPKMMEKNWGRIIFISSESAINIPDDMVHYGTSKAAMQGLARGIAKVAKGSGVTCNTILPGPTMTEGVAEFLQNVMGSDGKSLDELGREFVAKHRPSSLTGRFADPQEVANLVTYVASPLSSSTTGAALRVEGGIVESLI